MMRWIKWALSNLFTGQDNQDLSFVRIFGAIGFLMVIFMITMGVPLWTLVAIHYKVEHLPTLNDWAAYYTGSAVLITAVFAGLAGLLFVNERPKPGAPDNQPGE